MDVRRLPLTGQFTNRMKKKSKDMYTELCSYGGGIRSHSPLYYLQGWTFYFLMNRDQYQP